MFARNVNYIDRTRCQYSVYRNFKTATGILGMPAMQLAEAFGLQPQTIRQMRLAPGAASYRSPPDGWQKVVLRLTRERGRRLKGLIDELERG